MPKVVISNLGLIGINKDLPPHRLPANAFTEATNANFTISGAQNAETYVEVFTVGSYPSGFINLNWLMPFPHADGPLWVYASIGTDKRLGTSQQNVSTYDTTDITRVSGVYNNAIDQRWQGSVFQGLGVFNQEADIPQLWNPIDPGTALIDMPNWSTNFEGADCRVKSLRAYRNFLISMHISDAGTGDVFPFRIRWSDPAPPGQSPVTWNTGDPSNLSGEFDLAETSDYIVDGATLGEIFVVYKENSAWGLQYVGGENVMRTWRIFSESGLLFRDCAVQYPGGHFVVTQDDIITHTGTPGSAKSLLNNTFRTWYTQNINLSKYWNCFALAYPHDQEIWFCFPEQGATYATKALIWHWDTGIFGIQDLPYVTFAANGPVRPIDVSDIWG